MIILLVFNRITNSLSDVEGCCDENEVYQMLSFLETSKISVPDDISAKISKHTADFGTSSIT